MIKKFLCKSFWDVLTFQSLYFEMIKRVEQTLGGWKTVVDKSNFFSAHTFVKIWSQMIFESDSLINKRWHFSCKKMYKYIGWVFFFNFKQIHFYLKKMTLRCISKKYATFSFFPTLILYLHSLFIHFDTCFTHAYIHKYIHK